MVMESVIKVATTLREIRKEEGYFSYKHFAELNNIVPSLCQGAEAGRDIRISSLIKIAEALGYEVRLVKKEA